MIKSLFSLFFIVAAAGVLAQDPELRRHIKTDTFKFEIYVSDRQLVSDKLNDSLYYFWCKAQQLHVTQGGAYGEILHGLFTKYYHSGQLAEQGTVQMGLKHKSWKTWSEEGHLISHYKYRKGILHGSFSEFDREGHLIQSGVYRKGELVDKKPVTKTRSKSPAKQKAQKKWFWQKNRSSDKGEKDKKRSREKTKD